MTLPNRLWQPPSTPGRKLIFKKPNDLWEKCLEYFEWAKENPLIEEKAFCSQGEVVIAELSKMRAMTLMGLCLFLGISIETWHLYRKRKPYIAVTTRVEAIIYEQKFTGAAAELLNPNIIARDLGLADKQDTKHTGNLSITLIDSFGKNE